MSKNTSNTIDTEHLYDLLMPSSYAQEYAPYNAPAETDAPLPTSKLDALRERMSNAILPAFAQASNGIVLVSLTEVLVADRIDAAFEKFNCCKCDKCKKRVAAFALNELPPNYVAAKIEQIEGLLDASPTKDITNALVRAILHVKATPEH